jgi:hypothetical protein
MNREEKIKTLKELKKVREYMKKTYEPRLFGLKKPKRVFKLGLCNMLQEMSAKALISRNDRLSLLAFFMVNRWGKADEPYWNYWWKRDSYEPRLKFVETLIEEHKSELG